MNEVKIKLKTDFWTSDDPELYKKRLSKYMIANGLISLACLFSPMIYEGTIVRYIVIMMSIMMLAACSVAMILYIQYNDDELKAELKVQMQKRVSDNNAEDKDEYA